MQEPPLQLDWTAYDAYGAGDAYAHLPAHGAGFGKAAAVCIGSRTCQRADAKGVMCPSFRATQDSTHSTQHRAAMLRAALDGVLDQRVAVTAVIYPQPFGVETEWTWGRGPMLSADSRQIDAAGLHGGLDAVVGPRDFHEQHRGGRSGLYDTRVTDQNGRLIALFRGRSATIRGRFIEETPT